jgi:hypothetical protein
MIARDLQPKTDVKGGGGVRGNPKKAARALQAPEAANNKPTAHMMLSF